MKNIEPYFPGLHFPTLRRKPRSARQKLAKEQAKVRRHSITQLGDCFSLFIDLKELENRSRGFFSRRRLFSMANTFWAFFSQVLDADGGCQEVVRKVQAFAADRSMPTPSASTSAYCQARNKLDQRALENILAHTSRILRQRGHHDGWKGRRVVVVDGTGVSMPDTPDNQEVWPQSRAQKPGCGFPQARICACFSLQGGTLLSHRVGNKKSAELPLLRQQWDTFKAGDIFLGDKGFCSYFDVWNFQQRGVDSVITLARRTPVEAARAVNVLGRNDLLIQWPKPRWNKASSYSMEDWLALPDQITLRQIKVSVNTPGFRGKTFYLVTTLTDAQTYSASQLADLYFQRWDVELFFRDIKTTMGMDILRCRTPSMVQKEIIMHLIAYNAIRLLMCDAAQKAEKSPRQISFKATIQALRQWEPLLNRSDLKKTRARTLDHLTSPRHRSPYHRRETRTARTQMHQTKKKTFQLLTAPRHQMIECPHRSKYKAKAA